jgi:hypothetical protein
MDLLGEVLARKLVNFLYDDLCKLSIYRKLGYKERTQNWIEGKPALNAIKKLSDDHITLLLDNISQEEELSLHKSGPLNTQKVAEEIADQLVAITFPKYKTSAVPNRLIPAKKQGQVVKQEIEENVNRTKIHSLSEVVSEVKKTHDPAQLPQIIQKLECKMIELEKQLVQNKKSQSNTLGGNSYGPQVQLLASEEKQLDDNQFYEPSNKRVNDLESELQGLRKTMLIVIQHLEVETQFRMPSSAVKDASQEPVQGGQSQGFMSGKQ